MLGPLREAQPGIQDDPGRVHPGLRHHLDPAAQFLAHLGHHILVHGPGIHAVTVAAPVHHDIRHAGRRDEAGHLGVGQAAAHVVDQPGARFQGPLGHLGAHRVHADRDACRGQATDHGSDPAQFLFGGDALRARAGGFPAHVHDVRALGQEFQAVMDPGLRPEPLAPVREGVGGDVHHAHDQAPSRVWEPGRAGCPGRVNDHGVTLRGSGRSRPGCPGRCPGPRLAPRPPARAPRRRAPLRLLPRTVRRNRAYRPAGRASPREESRGRTVMPERGGPPHTSRGTFAEPDNSPVVAHAGREMSPGLVLPMTAGQEGLE